MGQAIPKNLPTSTLACPPSDNYIKQFLPSLGMGNKQLSTAELLKSGT
jgi:hypothetical protein